MPTGYNSSKFHPEKGKESLVLTVAAGESWDRVRIKGVDIFVESAKYLPSVRFLVIGIQGDALSKLKKSASPNIEFMGHISQEDLIRIPKGKSLLPAIDARGSSQCTL